MKVFLFTILVIFFFASCKSNRSKLETSKGDIIRICSNQPSLVSFAKDTQVALYDGFITLPKGWRFANDDTLLKAGDSTVRLRFHNKNGKLIFLQYGLGTIGNPAEPTVSSNRFRKGYIANNVDTSEIIFTDNPRLINIRKKSNYSFSTENISKFQATFFRPKSSDNGYIGIYIDSVGQIAGNIADLVLYADGLDSLERKEFEKVCRSLVIKDFK